jgi:aromatic acid exporter family member 1
MTRTTARARTRSRPAVRARRLAAGSIRLTEDLLAPATAEDAAPTARPARRFWARLRGAEPVPGLRTLKLAVGTVLAYVAAEALPGTEPPIVAALTALLVVQVTPYQSITSGWRRIGSVVSGVLVAIALSTVVGLTWWSLGLTVLTALVLAHALGLREHAIETPISAMLVLAVAGSTEAGLARVYETLVGAAVGVLVSLVLPRSYVRPAGDAIGALAAEVGRLLHDMADGLEREWSPDWAMANLLRARALEDAVARAREALARAEEGVRLNPSAVRTAHLPEALRPGLTALEYSTINLRVLNRSLVDRVSGAAARHRPGPRTRKAVARLLAATGDAVAAFGVALASDVEGPARSDTDLRQALQRAHALREDANRLLVADARRDPGIWRVNGALLAHVDRMLTEVDPDGETVSAAIARPVPEDLQGSLGRVMRRRMLPQRMLPQRMLPQRRGAGDG